MQLLDKGWASPSILQDDPSKVRWWITRLVGHIGMVLRPANVGNRHIGTKLYLGLFDGLAASDCDQPVRPRAVSAHGVLPVIGEAE